ncbi:hypothetical protein B0H17DRAFT_1197544 [Mycena rosella]|uniref:Metallo-beta-lactamase domain-containing protein n=1 Tax=Mycena rosella TaxID=1033263 RepID=A0AAD7DT73_MYCRO|nr:hypothetical protein B0H17DRAFT_1197544 [Mycena rosella]
MPLPVELPVLLPMSARLIAVLHTGFHSVSMPLHLRQVPRWFVTLADLPHYQGTRTPFTLRTKAIVEDTQSRVDTALVIFDMLTIEPAMPLPLRCVVDCQQVQPEEWDGPTRHRVHNPARAPAPPHSAPLENESPGGDHATMSTPPPLPPSCTRTRANFVPPPLPSPTSSMAPSTITDHNPFSDPIDPIVPFKPEHFSQNSHDHTLQSFIAALGPSHSAADVQERFRVVSMNLSFVSDAPCAPPTIGHKLLYAIGNTTRLPVTHLVYSHLHADHIGGALLFNASHPTIITHAETRNRLAMLSPIDPLCPLPNVTFEGDYTVSIGNQTLELSYHGPNHTPVISRPCDQR